MSEIVNTAEQDLAALGIVSSYIWKPNRLLVRNPSPQLGGSYIPADVISDGTAADVSQAVLEEGLKQISEIESLAVTQKAAISAHSRDYTAVKSNLIATYQRMYGYFMSQGLIALATIMATAIVNINLM